MEIEKLIQRGYSSCSKDSKWFSKFRKMETEINNKQMLFPKSEVLYGIIKYFDINRNFGIIESNNQGFIFFPNSFSSFIEPQDIKEHKGNSVSFMCVEDQGKKVAKQVVLL